MASTRTESAFPCGHCSVGICHRVGLGRGGDLATQYSPVRRPLAVSRASVGTLPQPAVAPWIKARKTTRQLEQSRHPHDTGHPVVEARDCFAVGQGTQYRKCAVDTGNMHIDRAVAKLMI